MIASHLTRYVAMAARALGPEVCRRVPVVSVPALPRAGVFSVGSGGAMRESHSSVITELARKVVKQYGVDLPPLSVVVTQLSGHAAQIKIAAGVTALLVSDEYVVDSFQLASIVAHEMAHHVLHRRGLEMTPPSENERLTDSVAVMAGFGQLMLKGYKKDESWTVPNGTHTRTTTLGYLSLQEIHTLQEHRERMRAVTLKKRRSPIVQGSARPLICWGCYNSLQIPGAHGRFRAKCRACGCIQQVQISPRMKQRRVFSRAWSALVLRPLDRADGLP